MSFLHLNITGVEAPKGFFSSLFILICLLSIGTGFYSKVEGWSYFDSFYFTVVTITTVGYGDLHPTTVESKAFTMFLIFMGVGLGLFVITSVADSFRAGREKQYERLERLIGRGEEKDT